MTVQAVRGAQLHGQVVEQLTADLHEVTVAPRSCLRAHVLRTEPGLGKSTLLARLREGLRAGEPDRAAPVVVALSGRGETGQRDVASAMVLGQARAALQVQEATRHYERTSQEARDEALRALPDVALSIASALFPAVGVVKAAQEAKGLLDGLADAYGHGRRLQQLRAARAGLETVHGEEHVTDLTLQVLDDLAAQWRLLDGAQQAPTLVLLVDDVCAAAPDLLVWLADVVARVLLAPDRAMSVLLVTTGSPEEAEDPLVAAVLGEVEGATELDLDSTLWSDDALPEAQDGQRALCGLTQDSAAQVLRDLLPAVLPAEEVDGLVPGLLARLTTTAPTVNPRRLQQLVRLVGQRRRGGPLDPARLAELPGDAEAAAQARVQAELEEGMAPDWAVALVAVGVAGGRALPAVLSDAVASLLSGQGTTVLTELEQAGLVETGVPFALGGEGLVGETSAQAGREVAARLETDTGLTVQAVRQAYLAALARRLDAALPHLVEEHSHLTVAPFLEHLRGVGVPPGLDPVEVPDPGTGLGAVTLRALAHDTPQGQLAQLLELEEGRRDEAWLLLVAGLTHELQDTEPDDTTVSALEQALRRAESLHLRSRSSQAAAAAVSLHALQARRLHLLHGVATAVLEQTASDSVDAAQALLRAAGDGDLRERAADLLLAHLQQDADVADDGARLALARELLERGDTALVPSVLAPVAGRSVDAAVLLAPLLRHEDAEDTSGDAGGDAGAGATAQDVDEDAADEDRPEAPDLLATVLAVLRTAHRDRADAALALLDLEAPSEADAAALLLPHLERSVEAVRRCVELVGGAPAEPVRRALYDALHRHHAHFGRVELALHLTALARTPAEHDASRAYVEAAADELPVAASLVVTTPDLDDRVFELVEPTFRRAGRDGAETPARAAEAAWARLSTEEVRRRPRVLALLALLAPESADLRRWLREHLREQPDVWAVLLSAQRLLRDTESPGGRSRARALPRVLEQLDRLLDEHEPAAEQGQALPDAVFELCALAPRLFGSWQHHGAPDAEPEPLVAVRRRAQRLLDTSLSRSSAAALAVLRRPYPDRAEALLEGAVAAHPHDVRVLAAAARCARHVLKQPDRARELFERLVRLAQSHPASAHVLLDLLQRRRDWPVEQAEVEQALAQLLELAQVDTGLALRLHELDLALELDATATAELLVDHAPLDLRAARAAAAFFREAGHPELGTVLTELAETDERHADLLADWADARGLQALDARSLVVLRGLARVSAPAALALHRGARPGTTDRLLALDRLADQARRLRSARSRQARARGFAERVQQERLPEFLAAVAQGAPDDQVQALLQRGCGHDQVALWTLLRWHRLPQAWRPPRNRLVGQLRSALAKERTPLLATLAELARWTSGARLALFRDLLVPRLTQAVQDADGALTGFDRRVGLCWVVAVSTRPAAGAEDVDLALRVAALTQPTSSSAFRWADSVLRLTTRSTSPEAAELTARAVDQLAGARAASGAMGLPELLLLLQAAEPEQGLQLWRQHVPELAGGAAAQLGDVPPAALQRSAPVAALVAQHGRWRDQRPLRQALLQHLERVRDQGATDSAEGALVAVALSRTVLVGEERARVAGLLAGAERPGPRLAAARCAPLAERTALLDAAVRATALRAKSRAGAADLLQDELVLLAELCQGTPLAGTASRVLEDVLVRDPDRPDHLVLRRRQVQLLEDGDDLERQVVVQALLDDAAEDPRLALALHRLHLPDAERARLRDLLHQAGASEPAVARALARDAADLDDATAAALLSCLRPRVAGEPADALAVLQLAQRSRDHAADGTAALRALGRAALRDPRLARRVVEAGTSEHGQVAVTAWLLRLSLTARTRRGLAARRADELAEVLRRGGSRSLALASCVLADTRPRQREAARRLQRAYPQDRLTPFAALAVLAVSREVPDRQRALDALTALPSGGARARQRASVVLEQLRLLAVRHPAALVALLALQPHTGQPAQELLQQLGQRARDEEECAAASVVAVLAARGHLDEHRWRAELEAALRVLLRWLARRSSTACTASARAAVALDGVRGGSASQTEVAGLLAPLLGRTSSRRLRLAAFEAWDLLDQEVRRQHPEVRRLTRPATHLPQQQRGPSARSTTSSSAVALPVLPPSAWASSTPGALPARAEPAPEPVEEAPRQDEAAALPTRTPPAPVPAPPSAPPPAPALAPVEVEEPAAVDTGAAPGEEERVAAAARSTPPTRTAPPEPPPERPAPPALRWTHRLALLAALLLVPVHVLARGRVEDLVRSGLLEQGWWSAIAGDDVVGALLGLQQRALAPLGLVLALAPPALVLLLTVLRRESRWPYWDRVCWGTAAAAVVLSTLPLLLAVLLVLVNLVIGLALFVLLIAIAGVILTVVFGG